MKNRHFFQIACFAGLVAGLITLASHLSAEERGSAAPQIGPGSLVTIQPDIQYDPVYNRAPVVEVLASLPEIDPELSGDVRFDKEFWAKDIRYKRDIWCLQFSFKPVRIVAVDVPNKEGTLEKKLVWYLLYNVKNLGPMEIEKSEVEKTVENEDGEAKSTKKTDFVIEKPGSFLGTDVDKAYNVPVPEDVQVQADGETIKLQGEAPLVLRELPGTFQPDSGKLESIRCVPQFTFAIDRLVLGSETSNDPETGKIKSNVSEEAVFSVDQCIPLAIPAIMRREGMSVMPETTASFPNRELKAGENRWGVAMWTDIDPRVHRFSIYVSGLTNAYRWSDDGSNTGTPGEGRTMQRRALKTNWWRIGDQYNLNDSQIRYGFPGDIDYEWLFL